MADQAQTAGETAITSEGYPVVIPAEDGGHWILVQGSSCEITSGVAAPVETPSSLSSSWIDKFIDLIPIAEMAVGGVLVVGGAVL